MIYLILYILTIIILKLILRKVWNSEKVANRLSIHTKYDFDFISMAAWIPMINEIILFALIVVGSYNTIAGLISNEKPEYPKHLK